jgi:hypothetical protein
MELFFQHNNLTDEPAPERYAAAAAGLKSPGVITRCEPPHTASLLSQKTWTRRRACPF